MKINFDELHEVARANPGAPKGQDFRFKWNMDKDMFTVSNVLFDELDLATNSLTQFAVPSAVLLAIKGGNSGRFYKTKSTGLKGKSFKNVELGNALRKLGIAGPKLDIVPALDDDTGEHLIHEGAYLYQVVAAVPAEPTATEVSEPEVIVESESSTQDVEY